MMDLASEGFRAEPEQRRADLHVFPVSQASLSFTAGWHNVHQAIFVISRPSMYSIDARLPHRRPTVLCLDFVLHLFDRLEVAH